MNYGCSGSELQTVCFVHVADDSFEIVSVQNIRDGGVVSVNVLDSQLPKHWTLWKTVSSSAFGGRALRARIVVYNVYQLTEWAEVVESSLFC